MVIHYANNVLCLMGGYLAVPGQARGLPGTAGPPGPPTGVTAQLGPMVALPSAASMSTG
jgi:hypothetical protein